MSAYNTTHHFEAALRSASESRETAVSRHEIRFTDHMYFHLLRALTFAVIYVGEMIRTKRISGVE